MSDDFAARFAAATDPGVKLELLHRLEQPMSDAALAVLADALADEGWAMRGPPGWEYDRESVAWTAERLLVTAGARAEPYVAAKLAHASTSCVEHAARILAALPVLAPATIDALLARAADRELQYAVGNALRGKLDARPLLDVSETRRTGFVATPDLEPAWLVELLAEPSLRVEVLGRISSIVPPPHHVVPALLPLLADPSRDVVRWAIQALAPLAPDDASLTATLIATSRSHAQDGAVCGALARRPADQLRVFVPELLAWLRDGSVYAADVLGALGPSAPAEVALALGHELASGRLVYMPIATALERLGPAALPALPALVAAAHDRDDDGRYAAERLVAKLRGLE